MDDNDNNTNDNTISKYRDDDIHKYRKRSYQNRN